MRRMGLCNRLRPEKADEYKAPHAAVWPGVLATISACNIRNFSIFLREPENRCPPIGSIMARISPPTLARWPPIPQPPQWWKLTDPCQAPFESRAEGETWAVMDEVLHHP
jgi:L-rhamnose mutarotase